MKAKQLKEMTTEELEIKLKDLKTELFNLRFRHATGGLTNPISLAVCKKDIARVKTFIRANEIAKG